MPIFDDFCRTFSMLHFKNSSKMSWNWEKMKQNCRGKQEETGGLTEFQLVLTYLIVSITNFKWAAIFVSDKRILSVCLLLNHWYVFKLFNLGIVCQKSNYGYSKWCNLCALCSRDIKKMVSLNPSIRRAPKTNCFLESDVK